MICGHCDSELHESRDCPHLDRVREAERAAELPDLGDNAAVETWLEES